jgi:hypothetical protein
VFREAKENGRIIGNGRWSRGRQRWQTALRGSLEVFDLAHPARQWVPSGTILGHHPFISIADRPQAAEGRCGYAGSNKAFSVERNSVGKEQLLEPLTLFE